jgi:hypothetical protein
LISSFCSGSYVYRCNGESAGVEERWQITCSSSTRLIQSKRLAPALGLTLEVNSAESADIYTQCIIQWQLAGNEKTLDASANYEFFDDEILITRHVNDEQEERRMPLDNFAFSPLMRIYSGRVIRELEAGGGNGRVLTPWIRDHTQHDELLWPLFSDRQVKLLGEESIQIDQSDIACQKFEYTGGEYGAGTHFWLDQHDVLLRYQWEQDKNARWEINLQDYHRD